MLCTGVVLALAAPLFYLLTKHFYAEDLIEVIRAIEAGRTIPPLDLERDIMVGLMLQFLLTFIALSLSIVLTIRLMTRRLWRPFDAALEHAEHFNLAQGDVPVFEPTDIAEFMRLNSSLATLMTRSKEHYRQQKEFTENASHELQTPLAVVRSKLDLLMQEPLGERPTQLVAELYEQTTRMAYLNRNLLLLAKIDNAQYTDSKEVDVATQLASLMPVYSAMADGRGITVDDRCPHRMPVRAIPTLLDSLMNNLVVNALRYSPKGSEVVITLDDNRMTIANQSVDHQPLDSSTLFRRFRSGHTCHRGNGLGLAIVKAICDLHGWRIEYSFVADSHCFMVTFR